MRVMKKIIVAFLIMAVSCSSINVKTIMADSVYSYDENTKLYTEKSIIKGAKLMKKGTNNGIGVHQVVKIKGNKITLRGVKGYYQSSDPYFKTKKKTYKLSKKCKYYYTDVSYLSKNSDEKLMYKRLSKKDVKIIMTDKYSKAKKEKIYDYDGGYLRKKYYTGGFFGKVYVKKGKIVAILMNGGD